MSEGAAEPEQVPESLSPATRFTAGSLLKAARERQGLHIAALAVSMKVPVKKLEALEADRLDLLPDAVFVRALAASVCRALKIDAPPVLELLPVGVPPRLSADNRGVNTPFEAPGQAGNTSLKGWLLTPTALMVLLLLFAALIVYFYPVASRDATVSDKLQAVAQAVAVAPEVIAEAAGPTPRITQSAVTSSISPAMLPSSVATAQSTVSVPPVLTIDPTALTAEIAKRAGIPTVANQSHVLQFKTTGTAWVQVTDAKGVKLLNRSLQSGEVVSVAGALPLAVVVGRVDLTSVELHGKPYDLGALAQNNVARFEVKQ